MSITQSSMPLNHPIQHLCPTLNPILSSNSQSCTPLETESSNFVSELIDHCCITLWSVSSPSNNQSNIRKHTQFSNPLNLVQRPFQTPSPVTLSTNNHNKYAIQHYVQTANAALLSNNHPASLSNTKFNIPVNSSVKHACRTLHPGSLSNTDSCMPCRHLIEHLCRTLH